MDFAGCFWPERKDVRLKILHWDEMFHPSFGYQINLLAKFQARQGHEVTIISSDRIDEHPKFSSFAGKEDVAKADADYTNAYGVHIIRVPWHCVVSGRVLYKRGYLEAIRKARADILLCHTNDTLSAMCIARAYKKIGIPMVFDNHMLEMAAKNPFRSLFRLYFRTFITPLIRKNQWVVIRTQNDDYINRCLGIPRQQTPFLSFGSDTTLFHPDAEARKRFRAEQDISEDAFVIVYAGKLDDAKGGKLLAETFVDAFDTRRPVVVVVVGTADGEYGAEVEALFAASHNRVLRFPTQKYTDLAPFYQAADLSVFSKQCSLSFYDAQACGLPVVSEGNHINIERLSHQNGLTFTPGDRDDFREKIQRLLDLPEADVSQMGQNALEFVKKNYDYATIAQQYTDILQQEYRRFLEKRRG